MTPEDVERAMQFLLNQQAQFAVDLATLGTKTDRLADALISVVGTVGRLAESQTELVRHQSVVDQKLAEIAENQRVSQEEMRGLRAHLDALTIMFERHMERDHGAGPH